MTIIKANFQIYAVDDDRSVLDALRFALEASGWKIQTSMIPKSFSISSMAQCLDALFWISGCLG